MEIVCNEKDVWFLVVSEKLATLFSTSGWNKVNLQSESKVVIEI